MDLWIYAILFICGLALYLYAYRQGQKDERRVVQAWLAREPLRFGSDPTPVRLYRTDAGDLVEGKREGLR